jgi:hypothetical protein
VVVARSSTYVAQVDGERDQPDQDNAANTAPALMPPARQGLQRIEPLIGRDTDA